MSMLAALLLLWWFVGWMVTVEWSAGHPMPPLERWAWKPWSVILDFVFGPPLWPYVAFLIWQRKKRISQMG